MFEYIDVLDGDGNKTGESRTMDDIHKYGLVHRTAHVWILNNRKQLLLQRRAESMGIYPFFWDISSAGHISSGETSLQGAKRETKEELNLDFPDSGWEMGSGTFFYNYDMLSKWHDYLGLMWEEKYITL